VVPKTLALLKKISERSKEVVLKSVEGQSKEAAVAEKEAPHRYLNSSGAPCAIE